MCSPDLVVKLNNLLSSRDHWIVLRAAGSERILRHLWKVLSELSFRDPDVVPEPGDAKSSVEFFESRHKRIASGGIGLSF